MATADSRETGGRAVCAGHTVGGCGDTASAELSFPGGQVSGFERWTWREKELPQMPSRTVAGQGQGHGCGLGNSDQVSRIGGRNPAPERSPGRPGCALAGSWSQLDVVSLLAR